jgi:hypothetical protein
MVGPSSTLALPYMPTGCRLLLMHLVGFRHRQRVTLRIDGMVAATFVVTTPTWYAFQWPPSSTADAKSHLLEFEHPDFGRPFDHDSENGDKRELALCTHELVMLPWSPLASQTSDVPGTIPPESNDDRKKLAMRFQSLGHNCEFGLFQRRCGAEPLGPLRFAFISVARLIEGLQVGFADIGSEDLDLIRNAKNEWAGRHKRYGLNYHTFNFEEQLPPSFLPQERQRLDFLARLLRDQLAGAEKIFVIQSPDMNLEQVLPVLRLLRLYSAENRLLWVTPTNDANLHGKVEMLGPGFCKGYIDQLAPGEDAHKLSFDCWLQICATAAEAMP